MSWSLLHEQAENVCMGSAVPYDVMLYTHKGILFGRVMGLSKGPAIHQNPMQCSAMDFPKYWKYSP